MYTSVLYKWLERLNINVTQPFIYTYQSDMLCSKGLAAENRFISTYAENQILVKNFTTFNMRKYRKEGTAYTDLFKIKMKKLFLESRKTLALERLNLHLSYLNKSIGFNLSVKDLNPFMEALMGEAIIVQDYEYEEYINYFLIKVKEMKSDKNFEMEPGYPRFVFTSALMLILDRGYVLPQGIYMALGRLAILIHRLKCQHDEKIASKNKKATKKETAPKQEKAKGKTTKK